MVIDGESDGCRNYGKDEHRASFCPFQGTLAVNRILLPDYLQKYAEYLDKLP